MSTILIAVHGQSPLLMNRFTEENAAKVSAGTTVITVGSRGTPREQAISKLYTTPDGRPMLPGPNLFRSLIDAGAFHKAGRRQITSGKSSLVPAGIALLEIECPIEHPDAQPVLWEVDSRSVVIPATGGRVMAHRPRFDTWRIKFTLKVDDTMFDEAIVRRLVDDAGTKIGIGDFRPSRKGPFGRFVVVNWLRYTENQLLTDPDQSSGKRAGSS